MAYTWQYYDVVLVGVAVSMALGAGIGLFTAVALPTAVTVCSLLSIAFIGHGLFVNGPVDSLDDLDDEVDPVDDLPRELSPLG
jgi:hypothetical protein